MSELTRTVEGNTHGWVDAQVFWSMNIGCENRTFDVTFATTNHDTAPLLTMRRGLYAGSSLRNSLGLKKSDLSKWRRNSFRIEDDRCACLRNSLWPHD